MNIELHQIKEFLPRIIREAEAQLVNAVDQPDNLRRIQGGENLKICLMFILDGRRTSITVSIRDREDASKDNIVLIGEHPFVVQPRSDAKDPNAFAEENLLHAGAEMETIFMERPEPYSAGDWLMLVYIPLARHYDVNKEDLLKKFFMRVGDIHLKDLPH